MRIIDRIALIVSILGGINWGLTGIFGLDLPILLLGGVTGVAVRVVYILFSLAALWCITLLFRGRDFGYDR